MCKNCPATAFLATTDRQILPRDPEGIFGPTHLICLTDKQRKCRKTEKLTHHKISWPLSRGSTKLVNQQSSISKDHSAFYSLWEGAEKHFVAKQGLPKSQQGLFSTLGSASQPAKEFSPPQQLSNAGRGSNALKVPQDGSKSTNTN